MCLCLGFGGVCAVCGDWVGGSWSMVRKGGVVLCMCEVMYV